MTDPHQDGTIPDPLIGRKRSRVDAYMPWSSLQSLRPSEPAELPRGIDHAGHREPVILVGGCQLYRLSMIRGVRLRKVEL